MLRNLILRIPPRIRDTIYGAAKVAAAIVTVVAGVHIIDPTLGAGIQNVLAWVIAVCGPVALAGPTVSKTVLNHQRANGTLNYSGTDLEQGTAALRSIRERAAASAADLEHMEREFSAMFGVETPAAPADVAYPPAPDWPNYTPGAADSADVVTACGDTLR